MPHETMRIKNVSEENNSGHVEPDFATTTTTPEDVECLCEAFRLLI